MKGIGVDGHSFSQDAEQAANYYHDPTQWDLPAETLNVLETGRTQPSNGASYSFGEPGGDPNVLLSDWVWVIGQLQWAQQRFNAVKYSPDWFADNSKFGYGAIRTGYADAARSFYDGLYGSPGAYAPSGMYEYAVSSSTTDPAKVKLGGEPGTEVFYVPNMPDGSPLPITWLQMNTAQQGQYIGSYSNHQFNSSGSYDSYVGSTLPATLGLFDAVVAIAEHMHDASANAFAGYIQQDSSVERTWASSAQNL